MTTQDLPRSKVGPKGLFLAASAGFLIWTFFANIYGMSVVYIFSLGLILSFVLAILKRDLLTALVSFCLFFWLSALHTSLYWNSVNENYSNLLHLTNHFQKSGEVTATVKNLYSTKNGERTYRIQWKNFDKTTLSEDTHLLLITTSKNEVQPGDIITFKAKLQSVDNDKNPEYQKRMSSEKIYARVTSNNFQLITQWDGFLTRLLKIKKSIIQKIEGIYPHDSAALLSGMLTGERWDFSESLNNDFNKSGLSHIVVVSGYNIALVILFFSGLFKYVRRSLQIIIVITGVWLFTLLVGAEPPVLRASLFGIISYISLMYGKKIESLNVLIAIASFLIAFHPPLLNYNISFQLSFLAVLWLYFLQEPLDKIFSKITNFLSIRESLVLTLSATLSTLPIILANFGQLSIMSPISNLLVAPAIPFVMLLGMGSVALSYLSDTLAFFTGFIVWCGLKFILSVAHIIGNIPYGILEIDFGKWKYVFIFTYFITIFTYVGSFWKIKSITPTKSHLRDR